MRKQICPWISFPTGRGKIRISAAAIQHSVLFICNIFILANSLPNRLNWIFYNPHPNGRQIQEFEWLWDSAHSEFFFPKVQTTCLKNSLQRKERDRILGTQSLIYCLHASNYLFYTGEHSYIILQTRLFWLVDSNLIQVEDEGMIQSPTIDSRYCAIF